MDFKKFLPGSDEGEYEYFWALIIEPGWVQAGIWRIAKEKAQVMFSGIPTAWEVENDLINAIDTSLSAAIQAYPEDLTEPSKTVFGVVSSWVTNGEIKEEHLGKIKKICEELSLKPVGFVVLPEAIAHYIKSEEGSPLNAIVIGVYKETIEVSVFKLGNQLGNTSVARSVSLIDDVAEGLTRFAPSEGAPSRIILYDGKEGELDEAKQMLHNVNWETIENIRFLHTPKVEVIDPSRKIHTVSLAGASEIGNVTAVESQEASKDEEEKTPPISEVEPVSAEELGFVIGGDAGGASFVKEELQEDHQKTEMNTEIGKPVQLEQKLSGFRKNEEITPVKKTKKVDIHAFTKSFRGIFAGMGGLTKIMPKFSVKLPKFVKIGNTPFFVGLAFLILLAITSFLGWWFYPKATVTIYVSPKRLDEKFDLKVDPSKSTSLDERILGGELQKDEVSGEKTKKTTGNKTVGEKASGEVTLFRVGTELNLASGIVISGPGDLKFTLDDSVSIASGSASSPSTTKAKITASDIGSAYNLASGTSFRVSNYGTSDIEAKNESSFSGGTSREISSASNKDQIDLSEGLLEELGGKAKDKIFNNISDEMYLIEESLIATSSAKNFSNKIGDEATDLNLEMKVVASAVVVKKGELFELIRKVMESKVPDGFVLRDSQITPKFKIKKKSEDLYELEATVEVNLLPEIDTTEVAKKIRGKYPHLVEDFLPREVPGFVKAEIELNPSLPGRLGTLPRVANNIEVEVAAER